MGDSSAICAALILVIAQVVFGVYSPRLFAATHAVLLSARQTIQLAPERTPCRPVVPTAGGLQSAVQFAEHPSPLLLLPSSQTSTPARR